VLERTNARSCFLVIPNYQREDGPRLTLSPTHAFHERIQPENQNAPLSYPRRGESSGLFSLVVCGFVLRSLQPVVLLFALFFFSPWFLTPIVVWLSQLPDSALCQCDPPDVCVIAVAGTIVLFAIRHWPDKPRSWCIMRRGLARHSHAHRIATHNYPAVREALPREKNDENRRKGWCACGTVGSILLRSTIGLVGGAASIVFALLLLVFVLANPRPSSAAYLNWPDCYREQAHRTSHDDATMTAWRAESLSRRDHRLLHSALLWLIACSRRSSLGVSRFSASFFRTLGHFSFPFPSCCCAEHGRNKILADLA